MGASKGLVRAPVRKWGAHSVNTGQILQSESGSEGQAVIKAVDSDTPRPFLSRVLCMSMPS